MKKVIVARPTRNSDLTFEELYDDLNATRELKIRSLQARRWRALKYGR